MSSMHVMAAGRHALLAGRRAGPGEADAADWWERERHRHAALILVGLLTQAFALGAFLRPSSLTDNRVGYWIASTVAHCDSLSAAMACPGFVNRFFGVINALLPLQLRTVAQWDTLLSIIGWVLMMALGMRLARSPRLRMRDSLFFLASTVLSSMYVFMLSKDFTQFVIFLGISQLVIAMRDQRVALVVAMALFALEGLLWRPYFYIVASLLPVMWVLIRAGWMWPSDGGRRDLLRLVLVMLGTMLVFSLVIRFVSPDDYATIVEQHGVRREEVTTAAATTGIRSLIPVTSSSPILLFVANWAINVVRLMLPLELLGRGSYYLLFAAYQIFVSAHVLRTLAEGRVDGRLALLMATFLSFALAAGAFEPDFGSWTRHEITCLPILVSCVVGYAGGEDTEHGRRVDG